MTPKQNEQKASAVKKNQDVDASSIKEVRENKPDALVKDDKGANPKPDKEDQVVSWAAGGYSVDKKPKAGK